MNTTTLAYDSKSSVGVGLKHARDGTVIVKVSKGVLAASLNSTIMSTEKKNLV